MMMQVSLGKSESFELNLMKNYPVNSDLMRYQPAEVPSNVYKPDLSQRVKTISFIQWEKNNS